jgi:hypothetical protein
MDTARKMAIAVHYCPISRERGVPDFYDTGIGGDIRGRVMRFGPEGPHRGENQWHDANMY